MLLLLFRSTFTRELNYIILVLNTVHVDIFYMILFLPLQTDGSGVPLESYWWLWWLSSSCSLSSDIRGKWCRPCLKGFTIVVRQSWWICDISCGGAIAKTVEKCEHMLWSCVQSKKYSLPNIYSGRCLVGPYFRTCDRCHSIHWSLVLSFPMRMMSM